MTVTLKEEGDRIAVVFPYDPQLVEAVRLVPGRRWDPAAKRWLVPFGSPELATFVVRAQAEGEPDLLARIAAAGVAVDEAREASRAIDADLEIPVPDGQALLPYQKAGVVYALARPDTLVADEMGLGKTVQAIAVVNADPTLRRVAVICPASLKINWQREWIRWATRDVPIHIGNGQVWSWDQLFPTGDGVLIINYDILGKWRPVLVAAGLDLLVLDEAHYLKTPTAQRTINVLGKWNKDKSKVVEPIPARKRIALTGTPILNRPIELWGLAHAFAPKTFRSWRTYATRYCDAYQSQWGWDTSGASNLDELQRLLRQSIMVRRLKADVLTDLPAKRRQVIELPVGTAQAAIEAEHSGWEAQQERLEILRAAVATARGGEDESEYRAAVEALRAGTLAAFEDISALRHEVALAKVPAVIETLKDAVEAGKVVCFAHHRDVVAAIADAFGTEAVVVTGDTPIAARQAAVDRFQSDPTCRLFVGNMRAAGVGLTLTASSHVIFAELDWTPANVTQAEDRCHRIGQRDSVLVQHLVLDGSLDATMAQMLVEKQAVLDQSLDERSEAPQPDLTPIVVKAKPASVPQEPPGSPRTPAEEGWYTDTQGAIVKVQKALYGSGNLYAKRLTQQGDAWKWIYVPGLVNEVTQRLSVEEAAKFGHLYGVCGVCGRPLTDETSIARGIGPVCHGRLS